MLADNRHKSWTPEAKAKSRKTHRRNTAPDLPEFRPCKECGADVYQKPSRQDKFCSKPCYRAYLAKRFDRWIANPEGLALPQCYDEFLDREVLPCPIVDCHWHGRHLTLHVNQVHGLKAQEFKRAAGFNLGTGVICKPLAQLYSERAPVGIAVDNPFQDTALAAAQEASRVRRYRSKEGAEHRQKGNALMRTESGPHRICNGCGIGFTQSTPAGRALYCSIKCREAYYSARRRDTSKAGAGYGGHT